MSVPEECVYCDGEEGDNEMFAWEDHSLVGSAEVVCEQMPCVRWGLACAIAVRGSDYTARFTDTFSRGLSIWDAFNQRVAGIGLPEHFSEHKHCIVGV